MSFIERKSLFGLLLFFCVNSSGFAAESTIINVPELKWQAAKDMPPGAQFAVLAGNPLKPGHFIARVKLPANYIVPAHTHGITEYDTVISGTYYLGQGKVADATKGIALNAGDFASIPANNPHYGYTKNETILEISSDGPWGMVYQDNG
jgi:quercetin dioxygenase-like cupin family protein